MVLDFGARNFKHHMTIHLCLLFFQFGNRQVENATDECNCKLDFGQVGLDFDAEFKFSIGSLYKAPPLKVRAMSVSRAIVGARI